MLNSQAHIWVELETFQVLKIKVATVKLLSYFL